MEYNMEEIRISQRIFYYLLVHRELYEEKEPELYRAYNENETVMNLVKSQGEEAGCITERYGNVVYLIPKEDNDYLGFSKRQLKASLCRSGAADRDYYLSQFAVITLLVEFYNGQGSSSKARNYIRAGELMNSISQRLKEGVKRGEDKTLDTSGIAYQDMSQAFEALRSDEKGSRAKTTKEGFLYQILMFLQKQGLVEYVEADEMIYTTKKLDHFMDWNLLNRNHYNRVLKILEEVGYEQD